MIAKGMNTFLNLLQALLASGAVPLAALISTGAVIITLIYVSDKHLKCWEVCID